MATKNPWGREKKRMLEPGLPLSSPRTMTTTIRDSRMCSPTFYSKAEMRVPSKSHTKTKPHKCPCCCSPSPGAATWLGTHVFTQGPSPGVSLP